MQIKFFTIPIGSVSDYNDELNAFLRANKIVEIEKQLVQASAGVYWCIAISYLQQTFSGQMPKEKVDYMKVLDNNSFIRFTHLREIRREMAKTENISAFLIFTDAELAEISKLQELTPAKLKSLKGVGQSKVEKYGISLIDKFNQEIDEKEGPSDKTDI